MSRSRKPSAKSVPRRKRTRVLPILAIIALACGAVAAWFAVQRRAPSPPEVSMAAVDPTLATLIQTARTAVSQSPKFGPAWGKLGQALEAAEFASQAAFCYSNAARFDPTDFRWPYLFGLQVLPIAPDAALQNLERAVELSAGKSDGPRLQLARALIERGRFDQAETHLNALLAANSNHAAARSELARVYLSRGALKQAMQELQPALSNQYTMRPALLIAAQIAQRNGQNDVASHLARRAASLPRPFDWPDPTLREVQSLRVDRSRLADQVNAMLQQQRLSDAEPLMEKLVAAFPNDPETILLFGRLRYLQKRCPEAEAHFRRYLEQQPDSLNGLVQLGLALICQERWTNAAQVLERAITLKPDFAQAHRNLAVARSRGGNGAGAIQAYRDALRAQPGDASTHIALAEELANAGEVDEAKKHVERAAAINPNDPRIKAAREQLSSPR